MKERRRLSRNESFSEPDLTRKSSGFPPGVTVDELWLYRRKRPSENAWPDDNLKLPQGSFKQVKSEYKRRFKNYYNFGSDGQLDLSPSRMPKPKDHFKHRFEFDLDEDDTRENERLLEPQLVKRNLKLEGDFYSKTEQAEKFIQYILGSRPALLKKPTTLKMEGEMDIRTENREKYITFPIPPKPPLYKKLTNLHLEGKIETLTEKQEKFVKYEVQKRPPLSKKLTNLHMEGDLDLLPEYRKEFVEFKIDKTKPVLPVNHLKPNGFYDDNASLSKAFQMQIHPQIPNLRASGSHQDLMAITRGQEKPRSGISRSLQRIDQNLEFSIDPARLRKHEGSLRSEGKMDISPEYKRAYVDFPRRRPQVRRPEGHLNTEGEMVHLTEKSEKFQPFSNFTRTEPIKRNPELKLEGQIECQPEYRKAYIDYLIRERVDRKIRPIDHLTQAPRRVVEEEQLEKTSLPRPQNIEKSAKSRTRSLSRIESSVFGPKLTTPKTTSRSTSSESRTRSRNYDAGHKFSGAVLVENLASRSGTPAPPLLDVAPRNKWMRDSSMESASSAFVILDENENRKGNWRSRYEF